jgi:hypothetical protein
MPLASLPKGGRFACSDADRVVLGAILKLTGGERPISLSLKPAQAETVLADLIGHPRVFLGRAKLMTIGDLNMPLPLAIDREADGSLRLKVSVSGGRGVLAGQNTVWLWDAGGVRLDRAVDGLPAAYQELFRRPSIAIPAAAAESFLQKELPALTRWFKVSGLPEMEPAATPVTAAAQTRFILKLEGSLNYLAAELEARAGDRRMTITSHGYRPARPAESAALATLRGAGFDGPNARGEWVLRGEAAVLGFFGRDLPAMQKNWEVSIGARFEHVTKDLERVQPRFEVHGSGQNWFEVSFDLATGQRRALVRIGRSPVAGEWTEKGTVAQQPHGYPGARASRTNLRRS